MDLFLVNGACLCHTGMSVSCSLVVTCWERADLLCNMYGVYLFNLLFIKFLLTQIFETLMGKTWRIVWTKNSCHRDF